MLYLLGQLVYLFLPAGVANMAPVLMHNHLHWLARPIDGGRQWRGEPLFGPHKTWRGLVVAPLAGGGFFLLQIGLLQFFPHTAQWFPVDSSILPWWFGAVLGAGAILGDLVKSFFKRRLHRAAGKSWFPFDQVDLYIGAGLAAEIYIDIDWHMWVLIVIVGPLFHLTIKYIGYILHLDDKPI